MNTPVLVKPRQLGYRYVLVVHPIQYSGENVIATLTGTGCPRYLVVSDSEGHSGNTARPSDKTKISEYVNSARPTHVFVEDVRSGLDNNWADYLTVSRNPDLTIWFLLSGGTSPEEYQLFKDKFPKVLIMSYGKFDDVGLDLERPKINPVSIVPATLRDPAIHALGTVAAVPDSRHLVLGDTDVFKLLASKYGVEYSAEVPTTPGGVIVTSLEDLDPEMSYNVRYLHFIGIPSLSTYFRVLRLIARYDPGSVVEELSTYVYSAQTAALTRFGLELKKSIELTSRLYRDGLTIQMLPETGSLVV